MAVTLVVAAAVVECCRRIAAFDAAVGQWLLFVVEMSRAESAE